MSVQIVRNVEGTNVEVIDLDATVSESIKLSAQVTEHALEDGTQIADHRIKAPLEITVEGWVSSYPVTMATGGILPNRDFGRARSAYAALKSLHDNGDRVTIIDELDTRESYVMTDLELPRDTNSYNGVRFTATFREVRVVESAIVELTEEDAPIVSPVSELGQVTADDASDKDEERASYLYGLIFGGS